MAIFQYDIDVVKWRAQANASMPASYLIWHVLS